jgi:PDZ domain-containing protein
MTTPFSDAPTAPAPPPAPPEPPIRRRRWPVVVTVGVIALFVILLLGTVIRLPYVIYSPGSATPVDHVVRISGARTYRHRGNVLFLTVAVSRERPNVWRYLVAEADDDSEVVAEHDYLQGASRAKVQKENVVAMDDSQLAAKKVALEQLGYTVIATGKGALVEQVLKHGPAAGHLRAGDVIKEIDGQPIQLRDEVGTAVRSKPVGTTFTFTVTNKGQVRTETITSAKAPDGELRGKPYIGIGANSVDPKLKFPVDVTIDPGAVSGPSAGLAFTLTIIDKLSPGDLTGGKNVAVTGTIELDGTVGEVGGVPQKTAAAIEAGAKLFLVPSAEVREAKARAGSSLKVVGVDSIDDALRALRENGGDRVERVAPKAAA